MQTLSTSRFSGQLFSLGFAVAMAATLTLMACRPASEVHGMNAPGRIEKNWPERQLLFVADAQIGQVRVFHTRAAPQQVAVLNAPGRRSVLDLQLDPVREQLWILGNGMVHVHDISDLRLARRTSVPVIGVAQLRLSDEGGALLLAADGSVQGRIDGQGAVAYLRPAPRAPYGRS